MKFWVFTKIFLWIFYFIGIQKGGGGSGNANLVERTDTFASVRLIVSQHHLFDE